MAFQKVNGIVESLGFVHIFNAQVSQDSLTTTAIILEMLSIAWVALKLISFSCFVLSGLSWTAH
jgi:hypothetical protein